MVSSVEEMILINEACRCDRESGLTDHQHKNVVIGCVEGAKIAEFLAKFLMEIATRCVDDAGDLAHLIQLHFAFD
jgi:hypothetical protein